MTSFLENLLVGTPASSSTSSAPLMTPEQQAALKKLLEQLQAGNGSDTYQAPLTANQNNLQGQSLTAMEQYAQNAVAPNNNYETAGKALTDVANATPQDLTTYYQKSIVDPATQAFQQNIMPELTRRFSGNAGYGSDRILQEGIAAGNATTSISKAMADASLTSLQEQQRNKIVAAQGLTALQSGRLNDLLGLQTGGANQRAQDQMPLSAAYTEFQRQEEQKKQRIADLLAALGQRANENITTVLPGSTGIIQGAANGLGQALGKKLGGS
jgi:hypothetical protein